MITCYRVSSSAAVVANNVILNRGVGGSGGGVYVVLGNNALITGNTLSGNDPVDLFWDGNGSHNHFHGNSCTTSQPTCGSNGKPQGIVLGMIHLF